MFSRNKNSELLCFLFIFLYLTFFNSCKEDLGIGAPHQNNFPYEEFGKTIKDYIPEFVNIQKLNENDLKVIGGWQTYGENDESRYVWSYTIYPNRTFSVGFNDPGAPEDSKRDASDFFYIDQGEGLWRINNDWLELKIKLILIGDSNLPSSHNYFKRVIVNWEWQKVIKVSSIHPSGYTLVPFQPIHLPEELEKKIIQKPNYQPWYAFRSFGELGFNQLMTESFQFYQYPDGTHIYDSIESYEKYLSDYIKATTW